VTRTPEEYISALDEPRRTEVRRMRELIRREAPGLAVGTDGRMIGYGPFRYRYRYRYRYASGREGDTFAIGLASNARYISLYVLAADADGFVAERYRERLPKADIGRSCVRFTRVDDLDPEALAELIREGARLDRPGWEPR